MRAKDIIGKKVVKVEQTRAMANSGVAYNIDRILFDDGTILYFNVGETEGDYVVEGATIKPKGLTDEEVEVVHKVMEMQINRKRRRK